jgi:hypothetical protein
MGGNARWLCLADVLVFADEARLYYAFNPTPKSEHALCFA